MAKREDFIKELLWYGCENENNKREVIEAASLVIATLNARAPGKKLSQAELDKFVGGASKGIGTFLASFTDVR